MSIEKSLDSMSPVEIVLRNDIDIESAKKPVDDLAVENNSKIPPLLLRSPPPLQTSRSNSPDLEINHVTNNEIDIVGSLQTPSIISANSNFNIDFAFDLNNFNENNQLDEDEKISSNTNAQVMPESNLFIEKLNEKQFEFSSLDNNSKSANNESDWANFDFKQPTNSMEPKETQKKMNLIRSKKC